ncbi:MAG: hypothetical protein JKY19_11565 [Alcanivoracaceae bacterium]|nr:hypothetical protein [Alcanivoracaceae bacterium]
MQFRIILIVITLFTIISLPISAQETQNWVNDIPAGGWVGTTLGVHNSNTQCHSRGSLSSVILNPLGLFLPSGTPFAITANNNSLILGMSGAPATQGLTQTISFSYPVENTSFSIFDIDGSNTSWRDRLIVSASLSGSSVPVTISSCPSAAGTVCTGSGTANAQIDAGTTGTGFTSASGRGDISIAGSIDTITIQYLNHTVPTSSTQFISVSELTYSCAIIGASKLMTRRAGQAFGVSPYIVDIDFNFENFGDLALANLTSLEDLNAVFNIAPNAGNFVVTSISKTSGPASFSENAAFDGNTAQELIGASSSLIPGQTASIRVTLNVNNYDSYTNTISITGTTPQLALTSDASTDGTIPDGADGDNNPDESIASTLNVSTLPVSLNYLSSQKIDDNLTIEWQTDIEYDHIGYKIFQENSTGKKIQMSDLIYQPVNQLDQALKTYSFTTKSHSNTPIWLAEYSKKGEISWYGPFNSNTVTGDKIKQAKIKQIKRIQNKASKVENNSLTIEVKQNGMHRINYDDLLQAGLSLSNATPRNIVITLNNKDIPVFINGNQRILNSSTSFDFYAEAVESLYTNTRIYKLSINERSSNLQIKLDESIPSTVIDSWYWQTENYSPNLIYDFSSPTDDPWRAETLSTFGQSEKVIVFPLDEMSFSTNEEIRLDIQVTGAIDYQQIPDFYPINENRCGANHIDVYPGMPNDHCLLLTVNGTEYNDIVFDGLTSFNKSYQLNTNTAATGGVNVSLSLPGETGFAHDIVNIENVSILYPRRLSAIEDILHAAIEYDTSLNSDLISAAGFETSIIVDDLSQTIGSKAAILIEGFSNSNVVAYALDAKIPVRIKNTHVENISGEFAVKIPAIAQSNKYWVSTEQSLIKPTLKPWHQSQPINYSNVDYIIISHPDFIVTSSQLKSYHEAKGLSVKIVNVDDIYAEYSQSIIDPYAIKKYIAEISKSNILKYVLSVGSDNYDYKGYLSDQHYSHIPSLYTAIDSVVRYVPADSLYADVDNDDIPDLAIGRLPVRTNQELQLLIDKQLVFASQINQTPSTHFITDASDSNHSYSQISNELMELLPNSWTKLSSHRDNFNDVASTKQQIFDNFSLSPRLTTYLGHSGPRNWFSFPSAFTYNDIANVENTAFSSVILQWGCWNSYYVEPDANTMAHKFLFNNDKGGVAIFGASALTLVSSEKAFAKLIIPELAKSNQSIGISMLNAKRALARSGEYRDIIIGWNLLGDPALKLLE